MSDNLRGKLRHLASTLLLSSLLAGALATLLSGCHQPTGSNPGTEEPIAGAPDGETDPPGAVDPNDLGAMSVQVSRLRYNDRIELSWTPVAGAERYEVYRYSSSALDASSEMVHSGSQNQFVDEAENGLSADTVYYYRVAFVIGDVSRPVGNDVEHGIFSAAIDFSEPNDDYDTPAVLAGAEETAVLYSFHEGDAEDRDWYRYPRPEGNPFGVKLNVKLPGDSPLLAEAVLRVENNGFEITLTDESNYLDYIWATGDDDLVFSVQFATAGLTENIIGSYTVQVEGL